MTYQRQLVLRIIDTCGTTIYEHAVPLSRLGPNDNSQSPIQLRATIEPMPPTIMEVGAVNMRPWGKGE